MKLLNLGFNRKNGFRPRSVAPRKLRVETLERRELLAADFPSAAVSDAPSVVVTTCLDVLDPNDGAISLREAIEAINSGASPTSRITFDIADGTAEPVIALDPELGELRLTSDVQIDGSFAPNTYDLSQLANFQQSNIGFMGGNGSAYQVCFF